MTNLALNLIGNS